MAESARWRTRPRGSRTERGAAAVEFALVAVLLIFIILTTVDLGRLFFVVQGVKAASREGARAAVISTATASDVDTKISNAVKGASSLAGAGGSYSAYWTLNWTPPNDPPGTGSLSAPNPCLSNKGLPVTVRVRVNFQWFTPALPLLGIVVGPANVPSVSAETTMRCE